ncbi:type II secretion system minor pseudopilin GspK [Legionella fallonii]|uniref:Type II secretion system protein K n=1 Tax=Legionella fallonii LLAP-10 TaxID=1212491 RepID=A0A098G2J5_9GAMM|nr:type II secretion system minor pseudopilin GspK [Legionella fallonii]CEG56707.1 Type II secretory pathway protein [Legionella fallonii LLAP-10]
MRPFKMKQTGSALLTALFIMTLVAIVATAMSTRLQQDIYRTRLVVTHDKLYFASQVVTFWAFDQLNDKAQKFSKANQQGLVAQYPKNMGEIVNNIKVSGSLYDLQGRFNLNNLVDKKSMGMFISLLSNTTTKLNNEDRLNLMLAVKDWVSPYDLARGKDSYTDYYLSQKPPYYPSHQLMTSATELRLVKDVNASLFQSLEPFITALPEATPININTASKKVLMSLGNGLNEEQVNEIIMARGEEGIKNLKDISELMKKINLSSEQITIESKYFLCVTYASSDEFKLAVYTLLKRGQDKQARITVSIVRESISG